MGGSTGCRAGLSNGAPSGDELGPTLAKPIAAAGQRYFHSSVAIRRRSDQYRGATLHILYPEETYRQAWRDVVYPPLLVGAGALLLAVVFSWGIASRVTRPLGRLQRQVDEIATGKFRSLSAPQRNDEIADLSRSINRMAEMLAQYEAEVRSNEQLKILGQLGGGIAHQIRNSVTGCRLAVELHSRECRLTGDSLHVATRQLELMERYLQRFLSLGRAGTRPHRPIELRQIVDSVVSLVGPTARHLGVALSQGHSDERLEVCGDSDALEQLLVNLVLNGVEAASQAPGLPDVPADAKKTMAPQVTVSLRRLDHRAEIIVEDTGNGPAADVAGRLFEPFVTEKAHGTGLGLAVAREIAAAHAGEIRFRRDEGTTCFVVDLPAAPPQEGQEGDARGETIGC